MHRRQLPGFRPCVALVAPLQPVRSVQFWPAPQRRRNRPHASGAARAVVARRGVAGAAPPIGGGGVADHVAAPLEDAPGDPDPAESGAASASGQSSGESSADEGGGSTGSAASDEDNYIDALLDP